MRAASDLGFRVTVPTDAVLGFDLPGRMAARPLFDATMALLDGDFAQLTETGALCTRLRG